MMFGFLRVWFTYGSRRKAHTDLPSDNAGQVQFGETEKQPAVGSQSELRLRAALQCRQHTDAGEEEGQRGHGVGHQ